MAFYKPSPQDGTLSHGDTNTEDFLTLSYKVVACTKRYRHDWSICPFAHNGEMASRRDPRRYLPLFCCHAKQRLPCPQGEGCPHAHSLFEYWLHPLRFRTEMCQFGGSCNRPVCFFAHSLSELRCTGVPGGPQPLVAPPDMLAPDQQQRHLHQQQEHMALLQRGGSLDAGLMQQQQQMGHGHMHAHAGAGAYDNILQQQQQQLQQMGHMQAHAGAGANGSTLQQQQQQLQHMGQMENGHMQAAHAAPGANDTLLHQQQQQMAAQMQGLRTSFAGDEGFSQTRPLGLPPRSGGGRPPLRITPPQAVDSWSLGPPSATFGALTSPLPLSGAGLLERAHSMPAAVPWGDGSLGSISSLSAGHGAALLQQSLSPGAVSPGLLQSARSSGLMGDYGLGLGGMSPGGQTFLAELLAAQQQQQQQHTEHAQAQLQEHAKVQQQALQQAQAAVEQQHKEQQQQQQQHTAAVLRQAFASAHGDAAIEELRRRLALELGAVTATGPLTEPFAPTTPDLSQGSELLSLAQQLSRDAHAAGAVRRVSLSVEVGGQLSRVGSTASLSPADATSVGSADALSVGALSNGALSNGALSNGALSNSVMSNGIGSSGAGSAGATQADATHANSTAFAADAVAGGGGQVRMRPSSAPSSPVARAAERSKLCNNLDANSISYINAPGDGDSNGALGGSAGSGSVVGHDPKLKLRQLPLSNDGNALAAAAAAAATGADSRRGQSSNGPIGAEAAAQLLAGLPQTSVMQLLSLVAQQPHLGR